MKKSLLQKPIKKVLSEYGFEHIKGENYAINAKDNKTKIILKIPNGKNGNGFVLGAQFSDFGEFDGFITHATMRQFDYAYELAYAESYEYTEEQIQEVLSRLLDNYKVYIDEGASAIKERIDTWTFGDLSDMDRDAILRYLELSGIDPYSSEYQKEVADRMINGGAVYISLSEYLEHKDFYDSYQNFNAKICIDEKSKQVTINFFAQRKWYQQ
jgi:hypothetical protein